jgi:hypothetical protein
MAQPSSNDINVFRMRFLQQMIEDGKKREAEQARRERSCIHRFEPQLSSEPVPIGYFLCVCSKCDRHIWRHLPPKRQ